ncbi:hypothetical protein [Ancylobacter sp. IITR112]|uniref:hypothetical protein n=1 Tax=Ancylobacter sp. IITR112 TaxID=3138073 RepID=UPI00352B51AA
MSQHHRREVRYRVYLTEVRTYSIDVTDVKGGDLESWAREGWERTTGEPTELTLRERRLEQIRVVPRAHDGKDPA